MSEGHTIHALAARLRPVLLQRTVEVSSPRGPWDLVSARLQGLRVTCVEAWGKNLLIGLSADPVAAGGGEADEGGTHHGKADGGKAEGGKAEPVPADPNRGTTRYLHVHLGMHGTVRTVPGSPLGTRTPLNTPPGTGARATGAASSRDRSAGRPWREPGQGAPADLRIDTGEHAVQVWRPRTCEVLSSLGRHALIEHLGPDPLRPDADPERGWLRLHASCDPIGVAVLDQRVIAGIGNVYRAELLWRQRLDPFQPAGSVRRDAFDALWRDAQEIMPLGVATNSIVSRDEEIRRLRAALAAGLSVRGFRPTHEAYRRAGQPCSRCGDLIAQVNQGSRRLYYCPTCQTTR